MIAPDPGNDAERTALTVQSLMRAISFSGIVVAGCFVVAACSSAVGVKDSNQHCNQAAGAGCALGRSSWDVSLSSIIITSSQSASPIACVPKAFTMHLEPEAGGLGATLGYNGGVSGGQFTLRDRTYELVSPLAVNSCEGGLEIRQLSLNASDGNGDGVADLIGGSGVGTGSIVAGDVFLGFTFSFDLSGTPDVTRPTLISPGGSIR
jgi:hypothetical protein